MIPQFNVDELTAWLQNAKTPKVAGMESEYTSSHIGYHFIPTTNLQPDKEATKKFGKVFTPFFVVKSMVDKLVEGSNGQAVKPGFRIADIVGCGDGAFPTYALYLKFHYSLENFDPKTQSAGDLILELLKQLSDVTGIELQPHLVKLARKNMMFNVKRCLEKSYQLYNITVNDVFYVICKEIIDKNIIETNALTGDNNALVTFWKIGKLDHFGAKPIPMIAVSSKSVYWKDYLKHAKEEKLDTIKIVKTKTDVYTCETVNGKVSLKYAMRR
jgi:hypothetical protein